MEPAARKEKILAAIIESYIGTGEPVGSKALIEQSGLQVSSATVRNDMAELTRRGLIVQPHTSAGRVPTALGYRYYVDNLLKVTPLASQSREYISEVLREGADSPESILKNAAGLLSRLTDCIALATTPDSRESRVRKISFVQTGAHTAMAVLICSNGVIKTKLFRCEFLITPEVLGVFDKAMDEVFAGVRVSSINRPFIQTAAARFGELSLLIPSALTAVWEACELAGTVSVLRSGYGRLMYGSNPALAARIIEFLNNEQELASNLERLPRQTAATIGRENSRVELAASSVISTAYMIDGTPSGTLAAITPMNVDYARMFSIIETVALCVGEQIGELIQTNP